jgi:hypothetical protein
LLYMCFQRTFISKNAVLSYDAFWLSTAHASGWSRHTPMAYIRHAFFHANGRLCHTQTARRGVALETTNNSHHILRSCDRTINNPCQWPIGLQHPWAWPDNQHSTPRWQIAPHPPWADITSSFPCDQRTRKTYLNPVYSSIDKEWDLLRPANTIMKKYSYPAVIKLFSFVTMDPCFWRYSIFLICG